MRLTFVTNARAPYRIKQIQKIAEQNEFEVNVWYTDKNVQGRTWEVDSANNFKENNLKGFLLSKSYGYINTGLFNLARNSDCIIIGGYEQPTYILLSLICRLLKVPCILLFDGISTNRIYEKENKIKKMLKTLVVKNTKAIWGNGTVSKKYFAKNFSYDENKIFNQCLTVDVDKITEILSDKESLRLDIKKKYSIAPEEKVIFYCGRVINVKNLKLVIDAISNINENIVFFIAGGGEQEAELLKYADKKRVKLLITGFISNQSELFKFYSIADIFVLPSTYEPWGLVVNEAMAAKLPVLVSNICGCSMDLVQEGVNGYTFNPYEVNDLAHKIKLIFQSDLKYMGLKSRELISNWTFDNSKDYFTKMIKIL